MTVRRSHFCPQHAEQLRRSEQHALNAWIEVMRRGMQAYGACRMDAARIYLGSATEIALIRQRSAHNAFFGDTHLLKPLAFLIEVLILEERFEEAVALLSTVSAAMKYKAFHGTPAIADALAEHYERVELAEKRHFTSSQQAEHLPPASRAHTDTPAEHSTITH